jgi:hypothetical protein
MKKSVLFLTVFVLAICGLFIFESFAAFTSSVTEKTVFGNKRIVQGTYSLTLNTTTGQVSTGLSQVSWMTVQDTGATVSTNAPTVNETFPLMSGDVDIVSDGTRSGIFVAVGV